MSAAAEDVTKTGRVERTEPYLRAHQIKELAEERKGIDNTLNAPAYIRNQVQDSAAMYKRIKSIDATLHRDAPTPYPGEELDKAVRRERELRESITGGMPTQAEMRRTPSGAIDKHRRWEAEHKRNIQEWKNLRLRLHTSGQIDAHADAREVANIEKFRPVHATHELNMDNKLIDGKDIYLPPGRVEAKNLMDPDEAAQIALDKQIIARMLRENPETTIAEFRDMMRAAGFDAPAAEPEQKTVSRGKK